MSLKTMFKGTKEKDSYIQNLNTNIDQQETWLEEHIGLNACVDWHLLEHVIPQFHAQKLINFTNIVKEMANVEV